MKTSIGVVFLLTYLDSQTGGMERQALQLAKQLHDRGCNIFFITCAHLSRMLRDHLHLIDKKEGFRVYRIPLFGGIRYLNMVLYGTGALAILFLTRRRYQIIHAHQLYTSGLIASFAKLFLYSKKVLIKNAAGGNECGDVAELQRFTCRRFFTALMRRVVDQFVAVSKQTANEMGQIGFIRTQIIPNGVDINRFYPLDMYKRDVLRGEILGLHADKPIVLFVGRLGLEKNLFVLIDAIAMLDRPIALYVVGDGMLGAQLRNYTKKKGVTTRIFFVGSRNDIARWYQIADVFVLPSRSEGLSNVLLEAMSAGLPIIASDIESNQFVIDHGVNGCLFPKDDVATLAGTIDNILSNKTFATQLGQNARKTAEDYFRIDGIMERYILLYETLVR